MIMLYDGTNQFSFGCKTYKRLLNTPPHKGPLPFEFKRLLYFRILVLLHRTTGAVWTGFSISVNDKVQRAAK